jgi:hypothetical protein
MKMGININLINFGGHSHISILHRAELKNDWMGAKAGMKGWLEWNGKDFTFTLDERIHKGGCRYQYRVMGYGRKYYKNPQYLLASKKETNRNLIKRLKHIEATDEERVDYFIKELKTSRDVAYDKQNKNADYKMIKDSIMECIVKLNYTKANEIIENLVEDLKRKEDLFTPIINS